MKAKTFASGLVLSASLLSSTAWANTIISVGPSETHTTIQSAVTDATAGDVIQISAGTYNETLAISKSLTLSGPNAMITGTGTRASEAVVNGRITITSANVTLEGLKVTNPADTVAIYGKNSSGLTVKNNVIDGVNTSSIGSATGVYILNSNTPITGIVVSDNLISNIGSPSATLSVKGINFGDSTGTSTISNVTITGNTIQGITVGSKGAYGISFGYGTGHGGKLTGVQVSGNTISGLTGGWVHAIGMETDTGAATISGNDISDLHASGADEVGISFEDNPTANTATVVNNSFSADCNFGVAVSPSSAAVNASNNYWGSASGPGSMVSGNVTVAPYYTDAALTHLDAPVKNITAATYFATIQSAVTVASSGDTIQIAAGTYPENIVTSVPLVIEGTGTSTVIGPAGGTALSLAAGTDALNRSVIRNIQLQGAATGLIAGSFTTLENVTSTGNSSYGVSLNPGADLIITGSHFDGNNVGLKIGSQASFDHIDISNSSFDNNTLNGWYSDAHSATKPSLDGVTITSTSFSGNGIKGFYTERLSNAEFDNIVVSNNANSASYDFGAGIDINLKWKSYANIVIRNSSFTSNGLGSANGVALTLKGRDDGSTYGAIPGLLDSVVVEDCTFDNNERHFVSGEPGKNNAGPTNVTLSNNQFTNTVVAAVVNHSLASEDARNNYWGSPSGPGTTVSGNVLSAPYFKNAAFTEAGPIRVSGSPTVGYATIQRAINAAALGNTVEVDAGTFNEALTVDKGITLRGPNSNISPNTATRNNEAILTGSIHSNPSFPSNIVIEGFHFSGASAPLASNGSASGTSMTFSKNLVDGGSSQISLFTAFAAQALTANIDDNRFVGMVGNAMQINAISGSTINATISENFVDGTVTAGINADGLTASSITGNSFSNTGQQSVQVAGASGGVIISNNTFTNANTSNGADRGAVRLYGSAFTGPVNISGNVFTGGNRALAIKNSENITGKDIHFTGNSMSGVNGGAVRNGGTGSLDATNNYWGDSDGPAGTPALVSGDVLFNPWYGASNHALPLVLSDLRTGVLVTTVINTPQTFGDLYIAPGTTVTVTPEGSLGADKLELADGATIVVNEGSLAIGDGSVISGTFTVFNSFGSWNINDNTTFTVNQTLALISDVHIAGGKTLTIDGGGELILDGCVVNSQTPGTKYNIVADTTGVLTMARNVVTDANIDINTVAGSPIPANVVSRVYDNSFTTSAIEATAGSKVYHNLFDSLAAVNTDTTTAFDNVDGWGNVIDANVIENKFTLDFDAPVAGRTLDADGNLFVQTGDAVTMRMDVSKLGSNGITAAEALLGYNSNMLTPTGTPKVTTEGDWEILAETTSITPPSLIGMVDSALGLQLTSGQPGSSADETIAHIDFTAANEGLTLGFFRVQTNRVFDDNGAFNKDTRLTQSVPSTPPAPPVFSYLAAFTANTGELIIDNDAPEIIATPITGTQVQPSQASPVDVLTPATNPVFRAIDPVVLTFTATDHGLSGLDVADVDNDLIVTANNGTGPGTTTLDATNYTVIGSDSGGVVTYTLSLSVPAGATSGTYTVSGTIQDRSGNVSDDTTLGSFNLVDEAHVNVELQGFVGTTRDVTFVATGGVSKTWTKTITNFVAGSGSAILDDVPSGTTSVSAKTAWTLRSKVAATSTSPGLYSADLTGAKLLMAGDVTGDNVVNTLDYSVLRYNWLTSNAVSNITGEATPDPASTNAADYNLMITNFYVAGSAQ